jgi:hypothetical protein
VNVHSRARGLLALFLLTDVGPDDAPTRLVRGSPSARRPASRWTAPTRRLSLKPSPTAWR